LLAPESIDEAIHGDHSSGLEDQECEHCALLLATEQQWSGLV
jgi:hypothetical protein